MVKSSSASCILLENVLTNQQWAVQLFWIKDNFERFTFYFKKAASGFPDRRDEIISGQIWMIFCLFPNKFSVSETCLRRVLIILRQLKIWKAKFSSQISAFFPMFANWARVNEPISVVHVSECHFSHQIVANLPKNATKLVTFLKTVKICFFFKKNGWIFWKRGNFFQNL